MAACACSPAQHAQQTAVGSFLEIEGVHLMVCVAQVLRIKT